MGFVKTSIFLGIAFIVTFSGQASAQLTSPSYQINETYFGLGGDLDSNSTNYKGKLSAGELTVGNTASGNYQSWAGFNTTDVELLEVAVAGTSIDFGDIDPGISTVNYASATFAVRNYLSSGYVIRIGGDTLKVSGGSETIDPIDGGGAPDPSSPGTEQFGINLRANTSPLVGADPSQAPDSTFSFGTAASGYNTVNEFKFVPDDIIAQSTQSSGTTTYTVSFILNTAVNTPAGEYTGKYFMIAIPTF